MQKVYKSEASAAIHETAEALYAHGAIDEESIREFDESCLAALPADNNLLDAEEDTLKSGTCAQKGDSIPQ